MTFEEKVKLRETTFREQIQIVHKVEQQLSCHWVIQRLQFEEWCGVRVNPLMADDPIHEEYPISGVATYATSGEATDAMVALQEKFPDVLMRVEPVEKDIRATHLWPRVYDEKRFFGIAPTWGQLLQRFGSVASLLQLALR